MARIEQFVYTTTGSDAQPGYRVVAKSPGITEKTTLELDPYMLPAGVDPRDFGRSKSMVLVENGERVAYSLTRNMGRGPDGRPDALHNHTLVIDAKDFARLRYDSRKMDPLFSPYVPPSPLLPTLEVEEGADPPLDRDYIRMQTPLLMRVLYALVRKSCVAVRGAHGARFAQVALGLLPPQLRLVPFSTCAVDLWMQPAYRLVLLGDSTAPNLPKGFEAVDGRSRLLPADADLERSVRYLIAMASVGDSHLAALHDEFEKIKRLSPRKRLAVLTTVSRMAQSPDPMHSDKDVQMVADALAGLDPATCDSILSGLASGMRPGDRSGLAGTIRALQARRNIPDCEITRKSIERLLGQVGAEQRQGLLLALYESKKPEIHDKLDQLFEDFAYSYHGKDFFRLVAAKPDLAGRVKKFASSSGRNIFQRQSAVRLFAMALLESGSPSSIEPAIFAPYDLSSGYDLGSFESLLTEIFSSRQAEADQDFCVSVATAALTYMAGFGRRYTPFLTWFSHHRAERFGALADRLGKIAMGGSPSLRRRPGGARANGLIADLLRECGIRV